MRMENISPTKGNLMSVKKSLESGWASTSWTGNGISSSGS